MGMWTSVTGSYAAICGTSSPMEPAQRPGGAPPGSTAPVPATEITALLGRGTSFEGKLHFEGRVRIDGAFKGEIQSDDVLIIGDGAEVTAEIEVATVIVRGG